MFITNNLVSNKNNNYYKPYVTINHSVKIPLYQQNNTEICSVDAARAQRALLAPSISFGSLKSRILENRIGQVVKKYSQGSNPFVLNVNKGFIAKLANKIASSNNPVIIGITGESASGKTTILKNIQNTIIPLSKNKNLISTLLGDNYYKDVTGLYKKYGEFSKILDSGYSFDSPNAVDLDKLNNDLISLSKGHTIKTPDYQMGIGISTPNVHEIKPSKTIIFDSIFALNPKLRNTLDVGIYVDCPPDVIKERWYGRTAERHTVGEAADKQFKDTTEKAEKYVRPMKRNADVVLNGNVNQSVIKDFTKDLYDAVNGAKKA